MAIFNPAPTMKRDGAPAQDSALGKQPDANEFSFAPPVSAPAAAPAPGLGARAQPREAKESVIASDVSIEGKIMGSGNVRIAGRFTGDIAVEGDLTIEVGARVNGGVRARRVIVAGELEGNIESAQRVELVESGAMTGDVKAGTVTVAPGSRMRGMVEFGWTDEKPASARNGKGENTPESGSAA
ncbi:MAG: polymer-forming cytoskeletal protein [Lysobacter sp.]|nr:MAG: polymer-forming cytoskeletal protein [Lysobacter sp.]